MKNLLIHKIKLWQNRVRLQITNIFSFINKYWLRGVLVIFGVYILVQKDVSFQVSLSNTKNTQQVVPISYHADVNPQKTMNISSEEMNIGESFTQIVKNLSPSETTVPIVAKEKITLNKANNFHYISSIISPKYLQSKNVSNKEITNMRNFCKSYVKRFSPVAKAEMKKYGIPASITLAQGLLESDAGNSRLSKKNNNHFGIKCFSKKCGKNHCSNFTDDTHKDFFRKFNNAWESYRSHSLLLQNKRYRPLKKYGKNYKSWASGLLKAGYATDKNYDKKLIQIIEALDLTKYDG